LTPPSLWLPPRVALEHADSNLRLQAIARLLEEAKNNVKADDDSDDVAMQDTDDSGDAVECALSRRVASDNDPVVVLAAVQALSDIMSVHSLSLLPKHTMVQDILSALYQWSSFGNSPHKDKNETSQKSMAEKQRQRIVICCLEVLQYASKSQVSLEILVAHLGHWDSAIADAAALAIVAVLNRASTIAGSLARKNKKSPRKSSKKNWSSVEKAKHDLLNEFEFGSTLLSEELDATSTTSTGIVGSARNSGQFLEVARNRYNEK